MMNQNLEITRNDSEYGVREMNRLAIKSYEAKQKTREQIYGYLSHGRLCFIVFHRVDENNQGPHDKQKSLLGS